MLSTLLKKSVLVAALTINLAYAGTIIDLSAAAEQSVTNDRALATVSTESTGRVLKEQSAKVNQQLNKMLEIIRSEPAIKAQTGGLCSYSIYNSKSVITGWRVSASIKLETEDIGKLSEIIGQLQDAGFAINRTQMKPSAETQAKAIDSATMDALTAFQARAKTIAAAFDKPYKIKEITVLSNDELIISSKMGEVARGTSFTEAAMPLEAGSSTVTVTINGKIELVN